MNNQAITRNVIVIGNNVTKRAAEYIRKVHGKDVMITLLDPTAEKLVAREGLKKFISSKDERIYVLMGDFSEKEMLYARNSGVPFVQLEQDHHGNVTGFWTNVMQDLKIHTVSTDKEIEAFMSCGVLAGAMS
jgi:hypothetical protein